ncbi:unnamed protein product [Cyclocybe aegerita]|uniref:Nucleolar complex-associated protein 3 n=1 Tax=Cyclocybe aegerita TaxID=1973307 RepID=A0A8S0VVB3_CYCAE|nr:unnamed protein product [Cyclocybe aegerita]
MAGNLKSKRPAPAPSTSSKRRKLNNGKQKSTTGTSKGKVKIVKKEKAADRGIIPIPNQPDDDDLDLSDQDMAVLSEFGKHAGFLTSLNHKGLMRSKKETQRLHELTKPVRKQPVADDLPSLNSDHGEDDWSSGVDDLDSNLPEDENTFSDISDDSNAEMSYETQPRKRRPSWDEEENAIVRRLPIKLADGKIQDTGRKEFRTVVSDRESSEESDGSEPEEEEAERIDDVSTGARFGRPAVVDVLQIKSRKQKVEAAKNQIAGICQEILADPENSLGLLRRLHTFALSTVATPTHPDHVPNDPIVRQLAILSQLAIFKDIIPGYRIRALTEAEKAEKVSQQVARTRDWEQGLVTVYQSYLRLMENELKTRSNLADVALQSMCTLLTEVTHFNFRVNLMASIVARLSKKSWDKSSEQCSKTLITVLKADLTGEASLEIVRLMNRMIKERHFQVHPNVLSCLLSLRLRTELGVRASDTHADKSETKDKNKRGKKSQRIHLSKTTRKFLKEKKEIDKELREADAEVDKEERNATQTETLKLLFALYFRILKNPTPTPLLPSALSGISRFAHLVNIDFFKDLMKVLRDLIAMEEPVASDTPDLRSANTQDMSEGVSRRLMCIVTAFELLSGQGEALNIDLGEFITSLYGMLLPLAFACGIDTPGSVGREETTGAGPTRSSVADLLFRALNLIFSPRTSGTSAPPWRSAAFAKRLLAVSLHWPSAAALRSLEFVRSLVGRDPKLEAMLSTEDRIFNGVYRPDVDDPQLCQPFESSFWELHALQKYYWDPRVREEAVKLLKFRSS